MSYEHQLQYFSETFGEHEQYELFRVYGDAGQSGTKLSRPEFDQMIIDAGIDKTKVEKDLFVITGPPKFSRILVRNTSRFARTVSVDMLIKTLTKNGVYVDFIDTGLSTERPTDAVTLGFLQLMDQEESKDKSRKTSFGLRAGAEHGSILCHENIYGYRYFPRPENRLEIIPEEAAIVKRLFELYNSGMGAYRIAGLLAREGVLNRRGKPFSESSIRTLLANEKYCGWVTRMKYDTGTVFNKHSPKIRPMEDRVSFQDEVRMPAIVTVEEFFKAQALREGKVQHQTQKGVNHGSTDYAGKIFCGCCGTQYRATSTKQCNGRKERYYACVKKRQMAYDEHGTRKMLCQNRNVSETMLDEALTSDNYSFLLAMNLLNASLLLERIEGTLRESVLHTDDGEVGTLKEELGEIESKIYDLLQFSVEGKISRVYVEKTAKPLEEKAHDLQERINALEKPLVQKQGDLQDVQGTIALLNAQFDAIFDERYEKAVIEHSRAEILQDVKHIVVDPYDHFQIVFNTFDEVHALVERHKHILPADIIEELEEGNFVEKDGLGLYARLAVMYMDHEPRRKTDKHEWIKELRAKGVNIGFGAPRP